MLVLKHYKTLAINESLGMQDSQGLEIYNRNSVIKS